MRHKKEPAEPQKIRQTNNIKKELHKKVPKMKAYKTKGLTIDTNCQPLYVQDVPAHYHGRMSSETHSKQKQVRHSYRARLRTVYNWEQVL